MTVVVEHDSSCVDIAMVTMKYVCNLRSKTISIMKHNSLIQINLYGNINQYTYEQ